ncbi:hypothetical protein CXB51_036533 [Gossypium anomalum]|uniref:Uncharacterized protein n=1 Tax=Gossypium anomalum TaxID=47600 RepID=A0A8J5XN89_9ROSI|nr:hypothetical protein CXB51_036533 [Gossypium anomalum]
MAGLVIPWMLSLKTLRCLLAPPFPRPLPPFPLPDISRESFLFSGKIDFFKVECENWIVL